MDNVVVSKILGEGSQDKSLKYYVWYCSDNRFNILLFYRGSQRDQLLRSVLRGDALSTDIEDFDVLSFEGKITEDDDAFYKPAVEKLMNNLNAQPGQAVENGSAIHQQLVKAAQKVYPVDQYDGWPDGLSNTGQIKELTPALARRLLSLAQSDDGGGEY